jgi:hypothetical protein
MTDNYHKGVYNPQNPQKYIGKKLPIFRSSWELIYCKKCDLSSQVVRWGSECVVIPYQLNGKVHRYYPDFFVEISDGTKFIVEIKPHKETVPPKLSKKKCKNTILYEQLTYQKNCKKWEAAKHFCNSKGWHFQLVTEKNTKLL